MVVFFFLTCFFSTIHNFRASTLVCVNFFPFCTSKTYFFYITHLFLQNTHISLSIIHIYSNKIFIFLTPWTVTVRGERKKKRVRQREEREKRIKKSFIQWIITVYIYTVTGQDHCAYLNNFTKTNIGNFWIKIYIIKYFLYFRVLSMSWFGGRGKWCKMVTAFFFLHSTNLFGLSFISLTQNAK